ncbi:MAG TPA: energy coupling factor transporter S component ThiW [Candidatus Atribacteria bacterium]|nr:energy coupling factor transporter S component ThiW [Candidatus Atribacteria bacterium]
MEEKSVLRKIVLTGLFAAMAVILSGIHFPVGPTKCFPFQHAINAVSGVLLGSWYASIAATVAGVIRNMLGTGTIFAFPGGIPGALVVGIVHRFWSKDYAAFVEPLGTGPIGASISAYVVAPWIGKSMPFLTFQIAFLVSSIPGCILGFLVLRILRKTEVFKFAEIK